MSHVKSGGASRNNRKTAGRRNGVKLFGGQAVHEGSIIVRQVGATKVPGPGTFMGRNFTIHAAKTGTVAFRKVRIKHFTGKTSPRTQVVVE